MKFFKKKKKGYAVTLEVLCSVLAIFIIAHATLNILNMMNAQRYMTTVLTSTASMVARWGGTSTNSYYENVYNGAAGPRIDDLANRELERVLNPKYKYIRNGAAIPYIVATPYAVTPGNTIISVTLTWKYPTMFIGPWDAEDNGYEQITLEVESLTGGGNLIGAQ